MTGQALPPKRRRGGQPGIANALKHNLFNPIQIRIDSLRKKIEIKRITNNEYRKLFACQTGYFFFSNLHFNN